MKDDQSSASSRARYRHASEMLIKTLFAFPLMRLIERSRVYIAWLRNPGRFHIPVWSPCCRRCARPITTPPLFRVSYSRMHTAVRAVQLFSDSGRTVHPLPTDILRTCQPHAPSHLRTRVISRSASLPSSSCPLLRDFKHSGAAFGFIRPTLSDGQGSQFRTH